VNLFGSDGKIQLIDREPITIFLRKVVSLDRAIFRQ
jgi:hypothetical protein